MKVRSLLFEGINLDELPRFDVVQAADKPFCFTLTLICLLRPRIHHFFQEMVNSWLLPGKQIEILHHFFSQFEREGKKYIATQSTLLIDEEEVEELKKILPLFKEELLLGSCSLYHAGRILEMRGLNLNEKTSIIQEKISALVQRFSGHFDYDIFNEMQHFFAEVKEEFTAIRSIKALSRIIWVIYGLRKEIEKKAAALENRRHLALKLKRTTLETPFGSKEVVSVFIALNFLKDQELLEERHLLSAISRFLPGVRITYDSYTERENRDNRVRTFYLELEKENGALFSDIQLKILKKMLPDEIKQRVEQLVPPIFMPRNEEEVMRNILTLSHQLKFIKDIPQMIISFDEQTDSELSFTVVLVRLLIPGTPPLRDLFRGTSVEENLTIDRVKVVGMLRRRYPKEAAVLRFRVKTEEFVREDYSVDLYQARLSVAKTITEAIGEVRDYNGGMISKQSENFVALKRLLGKLASEEALLLQNFFHAIYPAALSTTLDPHCLKLLFEMLLRVMETGEDAAEIFQNRLFRMVKVPDLERKQEVFNQIEALKLPFNELLTMQLQVLDVYYLGFICLSEQQSLTFELKTGY